MQRQGTYKCPKCDSADSYEGTTLVNAGGTGMAREIGDSGAFVGASSSSTRELTVRKCRNCGEILGKKDYVPTASEREEARKSAHFSDIVSVLAILVCAVLGAIIGGWGPEGLSGRWEQASFSFWKMLVGIVIGGVVGFFFSAAIMAD